MMGRIAGGRGGYREAMGRIVDVGFLGSVAARAEQTANSPASSNRFTLANTVHQNASPDTGW